MKHWKPVGAGILLFLLGLFHAIWPRFLTLDWPTVALLGLGAAFCFASKFPEMMPYVKRLKLGEAEIELRGATDEIGQNLEKVAEAQPVKKMAEALVDSRASVSGDGIEAQILDLAAKDREAALIRLGIEIEKLLAVLCKQTNLADTSGTWQKTVAVLVQKGVLDSSLGKAIIEFRNVRNQVIHSGLRGPVKKDILARAIDEGLKILQYLRAAAQV